MPKSQDWSINVEYLINVDNWACHKNDQRRSELGRDHH